MISDERLCKAAQQAEKAFLASLPEPKDCKATFSPAFERKMKKLVKRTDHPIMYWIQKSVACLRACLKSFDKNGGVGDNRKKQAGAGENASIPK